MINQNLLEMNNMNDAILSKLCNRLFTGPPTVQFLQEEMQFSFTASGSEGKLCQYTFHTRHTIAIDIIKKLHIYILQHLVNEDIFIQEVCHSHRSNSHI